MKIKVDIATKRTATLSKKSSKPPKSKTAVFDE